MITYKSIKEFKPDALESLFLSVDWSSGQYPKRLVKAMKGSGTVISAWDEERLVGLINALDDGNMTAYVHYALVHPDYQGKGIGKHMLELIKESYEEFMTLVLISYANQKEFYKELGFEAEKNLVPMFLTNLKI